MSDNTQQAGLVVRDGFQGQEQMQLAELSARAAAEQARAMVEARYVRALKKPRDIDRARITLLKDCKRTGFAEVARYAKPVGVDKVRGWSVRFAEAAARVMGNLTIEQLALYDDEQKRVLRIAVTDLETNTNNWKDITIEKRVERANASGRTVYGKRINSRGKPVYIVEATEDDFFNKESSIASKVRRQLILQLIPGDLLDECLDAVNATLASAEKQDPEGARKKVLDAFASVGIMPEQLGEYLGHPVAQLQPAELVELRESYAALRDGETTWRELLDAKLAERAPPATSSDASAPAAATTATQRLAQKVQQKAAAPALVVETTATVVATSTAPAAAPAAKEPEPEAAAPKASEEPEAADPASPALTADGMLKLREHLTAKQAELVQLIGKAKAEAVWTGRDGVKTLRGCRLQAHAQERLDAADRVVELAKLDFELVAAVRELASKAGAQAATAITDGLAVLKQTPFSRDVRAAHEALDTLLGHLQAHGKQDEEEVEDLPWGDAAKAPAAREPGEEG